MIETPTLITIFNRPDTTKQVILALSYIKPKLLFISSDGPRKNVPEDIENITRTREIATTLDWDCKIITNFRKINLGLGRSMSDAITWFFNHVEMGIILEDDCIPNKSFFRFCSDLLDYYKDNQQIMHISGNNFQYGRKRGRASYYFSKYPLIWGWASWRRAWDYYDFEIDPRIHKESVWSQQWRLSIERQNGLSIVPNRNLVTNIGFGPDAIHTKEIARCSFLENEEITFPLTHPKKIKINKKADTFFDYAHVKNVPNLKLIWYYQFLKLVYKIQKRLGIWKKNN